MEIYESIAWIAIGFIPTLIAMEAASRLTKGFKLRERKENPFAVRVARGR
jgi:hypothetical protein